VKTAATELVRLDRKLSCVQPILKNLSAVKYPEPLFEEEQEEEEQELIDKNPHLRKLSIIETVPEEDDDGEKT
jgi:SET domain-containing protein